MIFVPCVVIQLCNVNQQMHTFQINVLIQFLLSSTRFEHQVFIIRKAICTCSFYGMFSCVYVSSLADGRMCSMLYRYSIEHILSLLFFSFCLSFHLLIVGVEVTLVPITLNDTDTDTHTHTHRRTPVDEGLARG